MSYLIAIATPLHDEAQNPRDLIANAVWLLKGQGLTLRAQSALYRAPSGRDGDGPDVICCALEVQSEHRVGRLVEKLAQIEQALGGTRGCAAELVILASGQRIEPDELSVRREMDNERRQGAALVLPHPMMHKHSRYIIPVAQIAGDWVHPVLHVSAKDLATPHRNTVQSLEEDTPSRDVAE